MADQKNKKLNVEQETGQVNTYKKFILFKYLLYIGDLTIFSDGGEFKELQKDKIS